MNFFKKINIFTFLMIVCVFAFVLRLVNIANFSTPDSVAESAPPAEKFKKTEASPPVSVKADEETAVTVPAAAPQDGMALPPPPPYGEKAFSTAEVEVLQSLAKRRDELNAREQEMGRREALLKAAEGEVDRKIAELNKIKGQLESLLNKQKTAEDERVNSLVKIYENMKPKEAARIFDTLEMDILLSVIGKMSERKSSPVLASMDPERARQVTIQLAEQRRLPGVPEELKKEIIPPPLMAPPK